MHLSRPTTTIDELIEDRVARGVEKALEPYMRRLRREQPSFWMLLLVASSDSMTTGRPTRAATNTAPDPFRPPALNPTAARRNANQ